MLLIIGGGGGCVLFCFHKHGWAGQKVSTHFSTGHLRKPFERKREKKKSSWTRAETLRTMSVCHSDILLFFTRHQSQDMCQETPTHLLVFVLRKRESEKGMDERIDRSGMVPWVPEHAAKHRSPNQYPNQFSLHVQGSFIHSEIYWHYLPMMPCPH